jgi:membrane-associated PAP2 superfamily phosphatase
MQDVSDFQPDIVRFLSVRHSLMLLTLLLLINHLIDSDRQIAGFYFWLEGSAWSLQKNYVLQQLIHNTGRSMSVLLAVLLLLAIVLSFVFRRLIPYRKTLTFVFSAVVLSSSLIGLLKHSLLVSCPWEFAEFGGQLTYLPLLDQLIQRNGEGCFPAGHATAGFAWVAAYWALHHHANRFAIWGFYLPVLVGAIFGFAQELRGAHFLSHDVTSFFIAWISSSLLYRYVFFRDKSKPAIESVLQGIR